MMQSLVGVMYLKNLITEGLELYMHKMQNLFKSCSAKAQIMHAIRKKQRLYKPVDNNATDFSETIQFL